VDTIRVTLHTSNPVIRAGTLALLRRHDDVVVLTEFNHTRADVLVVVEEAMTDSAMAVITESHRCYALPGGLRCVIATDRFRPGDLMQALDAGLVAVMSLVDAPARLFNAVSAAHDGTIDLTPELQAILLGQVQRLRRHVLEPSGLTLSGLSTRECDVLRLISEGLTTDDVAARLNYSERTVKNVLHGITTRLGLNNRVHAVAYAVRTGAI
jgi:DNA-binding NarL/FixJ family response regulator